MPQIAGNTAGTYTSVSYNIPSIIKSFSLANKTGGDVNITVGIIYGSTFDILYNNTLATKTSYVYSGKEILLPPHNAIYISVSGGTDFYFSIFPYK